MINYAGMTTEQMESELERITAALEQTEREQRRLYDEAGQVLDLYADMLARHAQHARENALAAVKDLIESSAIATQTRLAYNAIAKALKSELARRESRS